MGVIFFLSAQPKLPDLGPLFRQWQDVAGHLFAYAVLALLWQRALAASGVAHPALWAFGIVVLFGLSDELHQAFVPGRQSTFFDVAVDAVGAAMALGLHRWARRPPPIPAHPTPTTPSGDPQAHL